MKFKMLLFVFVAGLFSISSVNVPQDQVFLFNTVEGKCSVIFPVEFIEKENADDISTLYSASCKSEGMMFMLNAKVYDMDAETEKILENQKEEFLQSTLENFNTNMNGEIVGTAKTSNNGVEGKIATIKVGKNKVFYSVYINGKIEYQLIVMELEAGKLNDKKINSFKNSFKIF